VGVEGFYTDSVIGMPLVIEEYRDKLLSLKFLSYACGTG